jgi:hypothetical protein
LKHHIEAVRPAGIDQLERLVKDLAAAYTTGDAMAIREVNWNYGTSFAWDHEALAMQQRLTTRLKTYYAGKTRITDRSLEILGQMASLERLEFWQCAGLTDAGVAHLAGLPRLHEISLNGLPQVTRGAVALFPAHVRVSYSG